MMNCCVIFVVVVFVVVGFHGHVFVVIGGRVGLGWDGQDGGADRL